MISFRLDGRVALITDCAANRPRHKIMDVTEEACQIGTHDDVAVACLYFVSPATRSTK